MREFTSPKAIDLYMEAQELERQAETLAARGSTTVSQYGELMTEAAGLRALADDIVRGYAQESDCVLHNIRVGGQEDWLPAPFRIKVQSEDTGEKDED